MRRACLPWLSLLALATPIGCWGSSDANRQGAPDAGAADAPLGWDTQAPTSDAAQPNASAGDASDTGADAPSTTCPAPTGAGTSHASEITQPETWKAADSPHVLPNDLKILAKVTVEPCAIILLEAKTTLSVGTGGELDAEGTAAQPITLRAKTAGSNWAALDISGGTARFAYATIDGGGDPLNGIAGVTAAVYVSDDQTFAPKETLHVDHVTVSGSLTNGIALSGSGGFSKTSTALTIKGSAGRPIVSWANVAGTIPSGTYTGNGQDQILLSGGGGYNAFFADTTLADHGVPYYAGTVLDAGGLQVDPLPGATNTPLLTIAPGVTLLFKKGGGLMVQTASTTTPAVAALSAVGTAAKPITFSSGEATPAAGDWVGLGFDGIPDPRTKIDYAFVKFAGMTTQTGSDSCAYPGIVNNDAAIRFFSGMPATENVMNTTISDSLNHGIDRGYRSDLKTPDYTAGNNTFTNLGQSHCKQTYPRDSNGACPSPGPPPCP